MNKILSLEGVLVNYFRYLIKSMKNVTLLQFSV